MPHMLAMILCTVLSAVSCVRSPEASKLRHLEKGDKYLAENQFREAILEYRNVLQIDPQNVRAMRGLGMAHLDAGELAQAYAFLRKTKDLDPENLQIRTKLGTLLLIDGRPEDARSEADFVLGRDPQNFEAMQLQAGAAQNPEQIDAALTQLKSVADKFGPQAKFHISLGTLYFKKQDFDAAEAELREAVKMEPKSVEAHMALGGFHLARKDIGSAEKEFVVAADLSPEKSRARLQLADLYALQGKKAEAQKVLSDITAQAPGFLPAWRRLAAVALADKRYDDAKAAINAVLEKNASDPEAHMLRGRMHMMLDDPRAAIQDYQTVLKMEPKSAPAHYQLALAHLKSGNAGQAKSELGEATTIAPDFTEAALLLAQLNLQTGAIQPALEALQKLSDKQKGPQSQVQLLLGAAYLGRKQPEEALAIYRKIEQADPKNARAKFFSGVSLRLLGKPHEAEKKYEEALRLEPAFAEALGQIVELKVAAKQPDVALARVENQIAAVPKSGKYHAMRGSLLRLRSQNEEAEKEFLEAIDLEPNLIPPYVSLGEIYASSKRWDEALAKFDAALQVKPKNPGLLTVVGVIHQLRGDQPKAIESYEKALASNPRFAPAANNVAYLYARDPKKTDRALELAQAAREVLPEDPRVADTLGWVLYNRGVYDGALRLISESAAKVPTDPELQYHLGMTQHRLGNKEAAREALEKAVKAQNEYTGIDEAKATLESLK